MIGLGSPRPSRTHPRETRRAPLRPVQSEPWKTRIHIWSDERPGKGATAGVTDMRARPPLGAGESKHITQQDPSCLHDSLAGLACQRRKGFTILAADGPVVVQWMEAHPVDAFQPHQLSEYSHVIHHGFLRPDICHLPRSSSPRAAYLAFSVSVIHPSTNARCDDDFPRRTIRRSETTISCQSVVTMCPWECATTKIASFVSTMTGVKIGHLAAQEDGAPGCYVGSSSSNLN